jgi:ubiquinone/menaquinone biosynthesis C-methylase UbiE
MGPLLFEPYARLIAERCALFRPARILETAAGTGILTSAVNRAVPEAEIIATDVNPAVLEFAARRVRSEKIAFRRADAQDLPYTTDSFDVVLCQFGMMFIPDKVQANREARRVLRSGGHYLIVTFDRLELNPVPKAAEQAVAALFPDDPPVYMERGPFSYADAGVIERDLLAAGFTDIALESVALPSAVNARDAALGIVLGSPFRGEIERRDPSALDRTTRAVEESLRPWDGQHAPVSAHVVTAKK